MSDMPNLQLEGMTSISLDQLKELKPAQLIKFAEEVGVENAASMRKQDIFFAVLKDLAEDEIQINGGGVLEVLQDGFGFLRSPEANYLAGPDDIYVSPNQIRKMGLRTGMAKMSLSCLIPLRALVELITRLFQVLVKS